MRIEGPNSRLNVGKKRTDKAGGSGNFQSNFASESEPSHNAAPLPPVSGLDAILALQAVDDPTMAAKRAVRHGRNLLDALDEIKADLLVGQIGEGRVHKLTSLISKARDLSEPELESILDDIELRAKVELAKLGY